MVNTNEINTIQDAKEAEYNGEKLSEQDKPVFQSIAKVAKDVELAEMSFMPYNNSPIVPSSANAVFQGISEVGGKVILKGSSAFSPKNVKVKEEIKEEDTVTQQEHVNISISKKFANIFYKKNNNA